ncbi:hypothetical protein B0H67DRAFT_103555 [Lasiosphaeris hirsuta]|uniref:Uncharacterized protein n=1 Tax=Lasiosphaeris hirsuta TaxID=260670 RepID=A0AA40AYK4_9PEZI|nr:hypothetical protein B0H67DRAFT_103555 [Lasiosphaeris hirsuta]
MSGARAIKWAAEEHQVDIISMSFGFDHEIPVGNWQVSILGIQRLYRNLELATPSLYYLHE